MHDRSIYTLESRWNLVSDKDFIGYWFSRRLGRDSEGCSATHCSEQAFCYCIRVRAHYVLNRKSSLVVLVQILTVGR